MIKNLLVAAIAALFAFAANAAEVTTKDGSATFEVAADNIVTMKDGSAAKDGSYTLSDGSTLTIASGKGTMAPAAAPAEAAPAAK